MATGGPLSRRRTLQALAAMTLVPHWRSATAALTEERLLGRWSGLAMLPGTSAPFELLFTRGGDGLLQGHFSLPSRYTGDRPLSPLSLDGSTLKLSVLEFRYDEATDTLRGVLPKELVPLHQAHVTLKRVDRTVQPPRAAWTAPRPSVVWSAMLGAPLWADLALATTARGALVIAGSDDGRVHAIDGRSGATRWTATTGGAIRARPMVANGSVFIHSDDGHLYRLSADDGRTQWRVRVNRVAVTRLPPSDPKSRYDFKASAAALAGDADSGVLYIGTHEGKVLALSARTGERRWEYSSGGPVLAAPTLAGDRVFAGSFDGKVHALDRHTGRLLWTFDATLPVSSSPVVAGDRLIVGSRSYDLYALSVKDGRVLWNQYLWYSWIESTPSVTDGVAYVGSSDAAQLAAYDVRSGAPRWIADVRGMTWGTPAICGQTVFIGTRRSASIMPHEAAALALDRSTGRVLRRYPLEKPEGATPRDSWGFEASPVCDDERVYFATLDGRVFAFRLDGTKAVAAN